ncbi:MAG TPA: tetratricopeptide repeat protein, partial [Gemmatimonadales bacterium]|nr:tetratricopeptide repeat protein [Gemmatimonadales bacterium]
VPCAERLAGLMPGAGHMVHMPAHIYIRVGRYGDAIASNEHAVHTDETFIQDQRPDGLYPASYYPHNLHFLAFAATMAGRSGEAIEAARTLGTRVDSALAGEVMEQQTFQSYLPLTLTTFGAWDAVLAVPLPPAELRLATGLTRYARGVALAALGRGGEAAVELDSVRAAAAAATSDPANPYNEARAPLAIAVHALQGEIAYRGGRPVEAIAHYEAALAIEDTLRYTEPPTWHHPIHHALGAAYLAGGRAADAERTYREALARFPENGWALYGLAASLRAQGRPAEADAVAARFERAWTGADVQLAASRF